MTRVAIIAANAIMRSGTQTLLVGGGIPPNCIVTFETVADFLNHPDLKGFAVALLDDEPYFNNIEATIEQLLQANSKLLIILLSERLMVAYIRSIIKQGASGFIYKEGEMQQSLLSALSAVQRGTVYLSPEVSELLLNNEMISLSGLNKRDIAVLHLMAAELNVQEIAYHLHTSDRTVYRSREKLREALGVQTNEMIVDAARQQGLLEDA
ncbi:MAG: LuxR C-terminal-related transcriptional regulator [Chloroflexota bacterium]